MIRTSMIATHPKRRTQSILVQEVGSETLLYDETTHQAYHLNPTASAVWQLADGTRSVAQIAREATERSEFAIAEPAVEFALDTLRERGLLDGPQAPAPNVYSRRGVLAQIGAGAALALPAITMLAAPRAAQAYSGSFDGDSVASPSQRALMKSLLQQQAPPPTSPEE